VLWCVPPAVRGRVTGDCSDVEASSYGAHSRTGLRGSAGMRNFRALLLLSRSLLGLIVE